MIESPDADSPATIALSRSRIVVGANTSLVATVRVGAPGVLLLRGRVPGRSWATERQVSLTPGDWNRRLSFPLSPALIHEYRLNFGLAERWCQSLTPSAWPFGQRSARRSSWDLRAGGVYRFSGSVPPKLPGERVADG